MRVYFILLILFVGQTELAFSQSNRTLDSHGAKGLAMTEMILSKLDLPSWCWNGAHVFENVERNYLQVDGDLLDAYFVARPKSGLIDPQQILEADQRQKIEALIAAHDMKSVMPLSINILRKGQKLALTEDELKSRLQASYKNQTAIVMFYFYGFARGAKGYVLLDEEGFIEDWEVAELFIKSSKDASIELDDFTELESFMTNISKRSFWIEQRLIPPAFAEKIDNLVDEKSSKHKEWDQWLLVLSEHTMTFVSAFWVIAAGAWYYLWSRRWRKFVMPDADVPVRLGADYGATVSDIIEFSDPKISLSEQYDKLKNREL